MSPQARGLLLTTLGVLFVVPDSLFVRLIDAEPLVIAFWRGMVSGAVILAALAVVPGLGSFAGVRRAGRASAVFILLMGFTTIGFVQAVANTSVANVVFIFATIPVFAALLSRVFLGEPIRPRMVWTMAVVAPGLALIAYGSGETEGAHWSGDLWAVGVSAAYAGALTAVRRVRDTPMIPAIVVAYAGAALVILPFVSPLAVSSPGQWPLFVGHGAFIGVATCLMILGPRYISSAEVGLLILLESVLAPLLVWAVIGEEPGGWALAGGVLVIGALVVSNLVALRRARREGRAHKRARGNRHQT